MRSKARLFRHPMHPMLVMFPTALFPLLVALDVLQGWTGDASFWTVGFWVALAGLATTLAAIVPGALDMAALPEGTRAHRTGRLHALVGTLVLLAYGAATWLRWPAGSAPDDLGPAAVVDVLGLLLVSVQGFLGGELVYRHHVGVLTPKEGGEPVVLASRGGTVPMPEAPKAPAEGRGRDLGR